MSEEKRRNVSGSFVVCDVQEEYIEYLFAVLSEQLSEVYQFQLFHDPDRVMEFVRREETEALLIAEECRVNTENLPGIQKIFVLTDVMKDCTEKDVIPVFRYQSADRILEEIKNGMCIPDRRISVRKNGRKRIRDEPTEVKVQEKKRNMISRRGSRHGE